MVDEQVSLSLALCTAAHQEHFANLADCATCLMYSSSRLKQPRLL